LLGAALDPLLDPYVMLREVRESDGRIADFVYVDANRAAREYSRVSEQDLIGRRLLEFHPVRPGSRLLDACIHAFETGEPLNLSDFVYGGEEGASDRHYDIRGVKVGDLLCLTWSDVTEWYALHERFRLMAEHASDIVYQCDADWVITWVSPSVERELGWDPDYLLGHRPRELIHPEDFDRVNAYRIRLYEGSLDTEETVDVRFRRLDGDYHWFSVKASVVIDEHGGRHRQPPELPARDAGSTGTANPVGRSQHPRAGDRPGIAAPGDVPDGGGRRRVRVRLVRDTDR